MANKPILVTAAIIRKNGKILIAQRKNSSKLEPGKWEFPGGKVKFLEHPEDCLVREIKEELGINISVGSIFTISSHIYKKGNKKHHILLLAFLAGYVSGKLKNIGCQDSRWVSRTELKNFEFAEADIAVVKKLLGSLK